MKIKSGILMLLFGGLMIINEIREDRLNIIFYGLIAVVFGIDFLNSIEKRSKKK